MHTIRESNYTIIKQPRNGNSKAKKTKSNLIYGNYQAQLMGLMYLMIFTQIIHA